MQKLFGCKTSSLNLRSILSIMSLTYTDIETH